MANEKEPVTAQVDSSPIQTPMNEIDEETDAVLLDVRAAKLEEGAHSLKLAKDGHVRGALFQSYFTSSIFIHI